MGWEDSEDWLHLSWAASATLFVVAVAVLLSATPTPTQNDWPAWVQAVGSIVAILAAVWIDRGTSRRAARAESDREERLQAGVLFASREAALWIGVTSEAANNVGHEALGRRAAARGAFRVHLDHATQVLGAFGAEALAQAGLLPHVVRMRQNLSIATAAIGDGSYVAIRVGRNELVECSKTAIRVLRAMEEGLGVQGRDIELEIHETFSNDEIA